MFNLFTRICICALLVCYTPFSFAFNDQGSSSSISIECPPQLRKCLAKIQKMPEAQKLISAIQKEGPLRIAINNTDLSEQFGAFWDCDCRTIVISPAWHESEGRLIGTLLFELFNASVSSKFDELEHLAITGKISKENYVEAMEYLEYQNSKNAAKIAERGIQLGIFPESARLPTYKNFEEHYHYQKIGGHSAWIAKMYEQLVVERNVFKLGTASCS